MYIRQKDGTKVQYGPLSAKVTRATKSGDVERIVQTAREVVKWFDQYGWPDNWASWRNRLEDAVPWDNAQRWAIQDIFR